MDCRECSKYSTCTTLCRVAEDYVNQDYVPRYENLIDAQEVDGVMNDNWVEKLADNIHLTRTEKKICTLLGYGLTRKDIAKLLKISAETLRSHIRNIRSKAE